MIKILMQTLLNNLICEKHSKAETDSDFQKGKQIGVRQLET